MTADAGGRSAGLLDALYYGHRAHALVHEITMDSFESGRDAGDAMRADARIRHHLDADELERLLDPSSTSSTSRRRAPGRCP